ncbi:hypothetical protein BGZ65_011232, partial [Modicella reniformis]
EHCCNDHDHCQHKQSSIPVNRLLFCGVVLGWYCWSDCLVLLVACWHCPHWCLWN